MHSISSSDYSIPWQYCRILPFSTAPLRRMFDATIRGISCCTIVAFVSILSQPTAVQANLLTLDIANVAANWMNQVENWLARTEIVKQTAMMASQVMRLYGIYQNARATYESVGDAYDAVSHFNAKRIVKSWTQNIDIEHFGEQLNRWGIRPTEEGPLAAFDDWLFGEDTDGLGLENWKHGADEIAAMARRMPGQYSRDVFLRRIIKKMKEQETSAGAVPKSEEEKSTIDRFDVNDKGDVVVTNKIGDELVSRRPSHWEYWAAQVSEFDQGMLDLQVAQAKQVDINKHDEAKWKEMLDDDKNSGKTTQLDLSQTNNLLSAQLLKKTNEQIELNAAFQHQMSQSQKIQVDYLANEQKERAARGEVSRILDGGY